MHPMRFTGGRKKPAADPSSAALQPRSSSCLSTKLEALEAEGAALMNGKRATRVWPGALGSEVETSYEAALLSILTYKHTDLMMAAAETEAGAPSPRTRTRHRRRRTRTADEAL